MAPIQVRRRQPEQTTLETTAIVSPTSSPPSPSAPHENQQQETSATAVLAPAKVTTTIMQGHTTMPEPELNVWLRLYIYGIHGFLIEILFTAAWEFSLHKNWALTGCTSVWSLFIYGVGTLVGEKFYHRYHASVPLLARGLLYVAWIYMWEYTTGRILRMYDACPWDYSERRYNVHGLITLEYFPAWYTVSLLTEQLVIRNVLFLSLSSLDNHNRLTQKG